MKTQRLDMVLQGLITGVIGYATVVLSSPWRISSPGGRPFTLLPFWDPPSSTGCES